MEQYFFTVSSFNGLCVSAATRLVELHDLLGMNTSQHSFPPAPPSVGVQVAHVFCTSVPRKATMIAVHSTHPFSKVKRRN